MWYIEGKKSPFLSIETKRRLCYNPVMGTAYDLWTTHCDIQ